MEIENVSVENLIPYAKNAKKHPQEQIEQIKQSIRDFGFNDPLAVDENNVLIEGHGRLIAAKELGYTKLPCVRLTDLTEQQKKAYILAHNKLTMNSGFDLDLLTQELTDIADFDMSDFGFDVPDLLDDEDDDAGYYGDERERTYEAYNLDDFDGARAEGFYQMPVIEAQDAEPEELISFNYVLSTKKRKCGVHFYIDDYQFERIWNSPQQYMDKLREFDCVFTPDFSLYMDMPMPMKIWNVYRSRLIGQMMQDCGITVIPTLSWAEKETYTFCFDGIQQGGTVSVSTIGVKLDDENKQMWYNGMTEALKRIKPKRVLVYGGDIGYKFLDSIQVKYYDNKAFKRG
jgi:hypothetical protein